MIDNLQLLWFSLIFFFLFLEMGHPGLLYFLSFSCGAIGSFVAAWYDMPIASQLQIFVAGTCVALLLVHLLIKPKKHQTASHRSNLDALIGQKVTVFISYDNPLIFQAKIAGQVWQVRSVHDQPLQVGELVVIVDVKGCHLRVDRI